MSSDQPLVCKPLASEVSVRSLHNSASSHLSDSARLTHRLFPKSGKRDEKKKREDVREESQDLPKGGYGFFVSRKWG